ncbi:hypothetical protein BYT27DRAFT_7216777 [Phlegmacium glaucopus]|nr:hypothetical protein BYT27DRAFT_7216777 [Phlegmacium glaucopus]
MLQKSKLVASDATIELRRLRSLPAGSYKWTWGTDLTEANVRNLNSEAIQQQAIHSGYIISLPHGRQLGYDTPTASAHASAPTSSTTFTSLASDIVSIPDLQQSSQIPVESVVMLDVAMAAANAWPVSEASAEPSPQIRDTAEPGFNAEANSLAAANAWPISEESDDSCSESNTMPEPNIEEVPDARADASAAANAWPVTEDSNDSCANSNCSESESDMAIAVANLIHNPDLQSTSNAEGDALAAADAWPLSSDSNESHAEAAEDSDDSCAKSNQSSKSESDMAIAVANVIHNPGLQSTSNADGDALAAANAWPLSSESNESNEEAETMSSPDADTLGTAAADMFTEADALAAANAWQDEEYDDIGPTSQVIAEGNSEPLPNAEADAWIAANAWPSSEELTDRSPDSEHNAMGHVHCRATVDAEGLTATNVWPRRQESDHHLEDSEHANTAVGALEAVNAWPGSDQAERSVKNSDDKHKPNTSEAGDAWLNGNSSASNPDEDREVTALEAADGWPVDDDQELTVLDACHAGNYNDSGAIHTEHEHLTNTSSFVGVGVDAEANAEIASSRASDDLGLCHQFISSQDVANIWPTEDDDDEGDSAGTLSATAQALTAHFSEITIPHRVYGPEDFSYVDESWLPDEDAEGWASEQTNSSA